MKTPASLSRWQEELNFLLTNRIPRKWLTRLVRRISRSEHPWVKTLSMGLWRLFAEVDLSDARTTDFRSLHECFTRSLRNGARPIDGDATRLCSPCDGIVVAAGYVDAGSLLQAKGSTYTLLELLGDPALVRELDEGCYITLRLTSGMYHRFHSPAHCTVEKVTHFPGDLWNVNPPALKRVKKLYCQNERAVVQARLASSNQVIALVPVGAILVGSIRLHWLDLTLGQHYRGPRTTNCQASFAKGEEMGWFEHGSTVILLAPRGFELLPVVTQGAIVRMGAPLVRLPMGLEA